MAARGVVRSSSRDGVVIKADTAILMVLMSIDSPYPTTYFGTQIHQVLNLCNSLLVLFPCGLFNSMGTPIPSRWYCNTASSLQCLIPIISILELHFLVASPFGTILTLSLLFDQIFVIFGCNNPFSFPLESHPLRWVRISAWERKLDRETLVL